ncbi:hypothetical protein JCM30760_11000 [Thiomicrorhabdus hydrogeniphila]
MGLLGFLTRFLFYFLFVYITLIAYILSPLDFKLPGSIDGIALFAIVFTLTVKFGEKNGRYFTTNELIVSILTLFFIDILFQFFFSGSMSYMMKIEINKIINALIISSFFHLAIIFFALFLAKKRLYKLKLIESK